MSFFDSEVFKDAHSSYYEVLYSKKDHSAMCAEIVRLLNAELSEKRILEIGCGTGSFTTELSIKFKKGILAVDSSLDMLEIAKKKQYKSEIEFLHTDVLNLSIIETFSLIALLFHVTSYLTKESEIDALVSIFKKNTKIGDFLVFDFWNCKCVHVKEPAMSERTFELNDNTRLIRKVIPGAQGDPHIWPLQIKIETFNHGDFATSTTQETHYMRCFSTLFWQKRLEPDFRLLREWDIESGQAYNGEKYGSLLILERISE